MSDYWTFRGTQFLRAISGTEAQWFERSLATSIDVIASTGTRIIDVGATNTAPLSMTGYCLSAADAATLAGYLGTQGVLVSATGQSSTALLVRADRIVNDGVFWRISLEFEAVS